jgi:hypothetical protein
MEEQKTVKLLAVYYSSLGLIYVPVCLSGTHFWWHCPFK